MDDSTPGDLYGAPHRRSTERKLEAIANSALLRVLQFVLTGVAVPLIGWSMGTVLDRLNGIEAQFGAWRVTSATTELRMLQTEKALADVSASERTLRERVLALEFQLRMSAAQGAQR